MIDVELPREQRDTFFRTVWKITAMIPEGRVATYGQIGAMIPCPPGVREEDFQAYRARWVGSAMAVCPEGLPWQRVINSQGKISPRRGADLQRGLLAAEGVRFDARGKIDLTHFAWSGPEAGWLEANGLVPPLSDLPLFHA